MHYFALAADYDGTLALDGIVSTATVEKLLQLKQSGRKLILVTGRHLGDLLSVFPQATMFDGIVAENGALLYDPNAQTERLLAVPPSAQFIPALRAKNVPVAPGKVVVATPSAYEATVRQAIQELDLDLEVILNKSSLMIL